MNKKVDMGLTDKEKLKAIVFMARDLRNSMDAKDGVGCVVASTALTSFAFLIEQEDPSILDDPLDVKKIIVQMAQQILPQVKEMGDYDQRLYDEVKKKYEDIERGPENN